MHEPPPPPLSGPHHSQVVGKAGDDQDGFIADTTACIERVCQATVQQCEVKQRLGGKYVSLMLSVTVRAPEIIQAVHEELGKDPRVTMRY